MVRGAGVINQEIEGLESLSHSLKKFMHLIGIRDITAFRRERQIFTLKLPASCFECLGIATCDGNPTPISRKLTGNSQTDTAASAGNDSSFSCEIAVHRRTSISPR